ncbi:GGDEF domain-containing protein [Azoarcus sp. L1K30]|uniref:GGDEF domain-containing protein n=1 Tax=Azoarcus sp. L1K30 TaxID=2820277 RepID=UPI001B827724|nr:GGDEF domain-containing protein [Azoarcus sp. L1K30]MBR0565066.1 GGDEF domain-containing protein [Azoarcus sp. L1K30]
MNALSEKSSASKSVTVPEEARALAHDVIEFLLAHALHPKPINYAVAYEYRMGGVPALNERIELHLQAGKALDDLLMREFHDEYLAREQFRSLRGLGGNLQTLVNGLIDDISEAGQSASGFRSAVESNIARLEDENEEDGVAVGTIAADLLAAAVKVHASNEALRGRLEAADKEAHKLRDELERHRREAMSDPLTGLLNRRGMEYRLEEMTGKGVPDEMAAVVIDIDHFKRINDTYGHAVGDVVIRHVAKVMRESVSGDDVTVRFGGEEFVILLPRRDLDEASVVAESIRKKVERLRLVRRQDKLALDPFTISLGVATRRRGEDIDGFLARADMALYAAKNSGRNRVLTEVELN